MFGIGSTELLMILVVALVVLGPKSLAGFARTLGKYVGEFRRVSTDFQRTLNMEAAEEEAREAAKKRQKEASAQSAGKTGGGSNFADASGTRTQNVHDFETEGIPENSPLAQALAKTHAKAMNEGMEEAKSGSGDTGVSQPVAAETLKKPERNEHGLQQQ